MPCEHIPDDLAGEGELDLGVMELLDVGALGQGCRHDLGLDDGDAGLSHTMSAGHLRVHLLNRSVHGQIPVLLVHVVVACPRLVPDPEAKVLHAGGAAVEDLQHATQTARQQTCCMSQMPGWEETCSISQWASVDTSKCALVSIVVCACLAASEFETSRQVCTHHHTMPV